MESLQKMFPQLIFTERQVVRLKNTRQQVYLCVTRGSKGFELTTKTLQADNIRDPDLIFSLYYFTDAEIGETKMVLPVHDGTNVCLSMDDMKMLRIQSLREQPIITNEVIIPLEDPMRFMVADERFFYVKSSGSNFALEAMNGLHSNQFLAFTSSNEITIKDHSGGGEYTGDMLFSLDDLNISKFT